ncbi:MAG: respiratory nitrate reductase subunit gamma, partial [Cyclobacteriaceae bacterium]|nr:respiratory nitrate reductase subunit gamma [Cyclobacteriaceae bacterium]
MEHNIRSKANRVIDRKLPVERKAGNWLAGLLLFLSGGMSFANGSGQMTLDPGIKTGNQFFAFTFSGDAVVLVIVLAITALVLLIFYVFSLSKKLVGDLEILGEKTINIGMVFFGSLVGTAVIVYLVVYGLANIGDSFKYFMFAVLPYMALLMFLIGTIYRYRATGFKVSSLSSQFLEGRNLFWGSQPFHWGILTLFFGHLIAFLFPSTVIAWNRVPVRLLILEGSAFAFGLLVLVGLILLITRRFTNKKVQVITTRADILVYMVLLVQVLSGLGVAFFVRWGSTWFASTLTPYL